MKLVLNFFAELLVQLKDGISPSDGFFYISKIQLTPSKQDSLISYFAETAGDTSFWEEFIELNWYENDNKNEFTVTISGKNIGANVNDSEHPEKIINLKQEILQRPEAIADNFRLELIFMEDGDSEESLIETQKFISSSRVSVEICDDDMWSNLGYD